VSSPDSTCGREGPLGRTVSETVDLIVVGAGVVGLAVAREATRRFPGARVLVLEKEGAVAQHQSGHSSGVVHSGVYYAPGSLKARLCGEGRAALLAYAQDRGIRYRITGKLIVATDPSELPMLEELERRGRANGVPDLRRRAPAQIAEVEPEVRGIEALEVPSSAIIDFPGVAVHLARDVADAGGSVLTGMRVTAIRESADRVEVTCEAHGRAFVARQLVNCAGLYCDEIARLAGAPTSDRIVPFRGEFHRLPASRSGLVHGLVYPVPDPRLPFADVHLTPTVDGGLLAGPNAILAFAREGYHWTDVRLRELGPTVAYPGFWRMIRSVPDAVVAELLRSLTREAVARDLQKMVPSIRAEDLLPADAGVRAQAVAPDGSLREDFVFTRTPRTLHVINAPSPAATCSFAIAGHVVGGLADPRRDG